MQFHAEKPIFEWPQENINHSRNVINSMAFFAEFIGREAAKNFRSFSSKSEEAKSLIYNYSPEQSISYSTFMQTYFFDKKKK